MTKPTRKAVRPPVATTGPHRLFLCLEKIEVLPYLPQMNFLHLFFANQKKRGGSMKKRVGNTSTWVLICLALAAVSLAVGCGGGALTPKNAPAKFPCVADDQLVKDIVPQAELVDFSCAFKKWKGVETLHFSVAVKNVSNEPQRYRVNIFMDNGKAVGGLIPRKTKKGLVQPGQTASFVYPVKDMAQQPKSIILKISTVAK
jgi:hypothetical protein